METLNPPLTPNTAKTVLYTANGLHNLKRAQLQKLCKQYGCKASGKNAEMVERLSTYFTSLGLSMDPPNCADVDIDDNMDQFESCQTMDDKENAEVNAFGGVLVDESVSKAPKQSEQSVDEADITKALSPAKHGVLLTKPSDEALNVDDDFEQRGRSKSVTESLWEEIEERSKAQRLRPLGRSKSVFTKRNVSSAHKWDNVHEKQFSKMDSIANHYAAKRIEKPKTSAQTLRKSKSMNSLRPQSTTSSLPKNVERPSQLPFVKKLYTSSTAATSKAPIRRPINITKPVPAADPSAVGKPITQKQSFDLQASLARPLGYKPYTGPLKKEYVGVKASSQSELNKKVQVKVPEPSKSVHKSLTHKLAESIKRKLSLSSTKN